MRQGFAMTPGRRHVAYYRVSTTMQGQSGLGLEAQRAGVSAFLKGQPLAAEYTEVESGKRSDRPQLALAMKHAKAMGAVLVVAKIDRLARNLHFITALMESGVEFVAADMPSANRLTIHILAAVAEDEARRISERTKAALAAAKARGRKLGNPNGAACMRGKYAGNAEAVAALKAKASQRATNLAAIVADIRLRSVTSVRAVAAELNAMGIPAPRGGAWHPTAVARLFKRLEITTG